MKVSRKNLMIAMLDKDMSVGQLVEKSGLSRCTVSAVRGGKSCTYETAQKLAKAVGVRPEDIIE